MDLHMLGATHSLLLLSSHRGCSRFFKGWCWWWSVKIKATRASFIIIVRRPLDYITRVDATTLMYDPCLVSFIDKCPCVWVGLVPADQQDISSSFGICDASQQQVVLLSLTGWVKCSSSSLKEQATWKETKTNFVFSWISWVDFPGSSASTNFRPLFKSLYLGLTLNPTTQGRMPSHHSLQTDTCHQSIYWGKVRLLFRPIIWLGAFWGHPWKRWSSSSILLHFSIGFWIMKSLLKEIERAKAMIELYKWFM